MRALARLLERLERKLADAAKRAATDALERRFEKITADLYERWEQAFYRLIRFEGMIAEAEAARFAEFTDAQWERVIDGASGNYNEQAFALAGEAMQAGIDAAASGLELPSTFALPNPKAIAYLDDYGARLVSQISTSTRDDMRRLLTNARAAGWSYERTAQALQAKWGTLRVARPQQHIRSRAHMIAVTEVAAAYEQGNLAVYRNLERFGLAMEYSWLAAGDGRICPICDEKAAQGWVSSAQWGGEVPPAHPACRCSLLARVAKDGVRKPPGAIRPPDQITVDDFNSTQGMMDAMMAMKNAGLDPGVLFSYNKSDAIRALNRIGWTNSQIVKSMRVTHSQVHGALKIVRKPPPVRTPPPVRPPAPPRQPPPRPAPEPPPVAGPPLVDPANIPLIPNLEGRVLAWQRHGLSAAEIAAREAISVSNVRYYIRKAQLRGGAPTAGRAPRAGTRAAARAAPEPGSFTKPAQLEEWLKPHLDDATLKQLSLKNIDIETANELGLVFKQLIDDGFAPVFRTFSHIQVRSLGQHTYAHVWDKGFTFQPMRWSRRLGDYTGGGTYRHHEIVFNSKWFGKGNRPKVLRAQARDRRQGFHPKLAGEENALYDWDFLETDAISSTAYHEMAHAIENFVVKRRGFAGTGVTRRSPYQYDDLVEPDGDWFGSHVDSMTRNSEYGKKSRQEKWAELFSEYYTGNRAAMDPVAREFIEDLISAFKEAQT